MYPPPREYEEKIPLPDMEWPIKQIICFIQLPQLDVLRNSTYKEIAEIQDI